MKIMTCFIDTSAWMAIVDQNNPMHTRAEAYLKQLLNNNTKLVTNNIVLDNCLTLLKEQLGKSTVNEFSNIIDQSVMMINLRMDWISRRMRKNAILNFLKSNSAEYKLYHYLIIETLKKKKVDVIFTFDTVWKSHGLPVTPGE